MGCDIHAYIDHEEFYSKKEVRSLISNFAKVHLHRNYSLFYALANVRYDSNRMPPNQGLKPKGLPVGLSWNTRDSAEKWHGDAHSHSWLTVDELKEAYKRYLSWEEAPSSWYQFSSPEEQPVPEDAIVKEVRNEYTGTKEWYIERGQRIKNPPVPEIEAIIAAIEKLNGDNPNRSWLVFWFDN